MIQMIMLFGMIFCHIIDDFHLQGCMKNMKQKSWWMEQTNKEMDRFNRCYEISSTKYVLDWKEF